MRGYTASDRRGDPPLVWPLCDAGRRVRLPDRLRSCFSMQVPGSFMPPEDAGRVIVLSVELPPNAQLEDTEKTTKAIDDTVKDIERRR